MSRRTHVALSVLVAAAVVLSAGAVGVDADTTAADSRTIDACTVITEPGQYELTADVAGTTSADRRACVVVRSGNVTIDGNGHRLGSVDGESVFVGTEIPYAEAADPLPNVTVRNVAVAGDVELYRAPGATVRNVTGRDVYLSVAESDGVVVRDNAVVGTTSRGAAVSLFRANDSLVADNTVRNGPAQSDSRLALSVFVAENVTVADNRVRGGAAGVDVERTTGGTVENVTVVGVDGPAVTVDDGSRIVVEDATLRDSERGIDVAETGETVVRNATVWNVSGVAVDLRGAGPTRLERLRVGPSASGASGSDADGRDANAATLSLTGRNVTVEAADRPPARPANLTAVGGFANVTQFRGAAVALEVAYDESAVEAAGVSEGELRLYRAPAGASPGHVYAPMGATGPVGSGDWGAVPGPNAVNGSANVVAADVPEFDFGADGDGGPTNATRVAVGETVAGEIVSDETDWYAVEVDAGEAILPTLALEGPIENRALGLSIRGPDGESVAAGPSDAIGGSDYLAGGSWPATGRETTGAATARENGTYYVGVDAGPTNERLPPGRYNLTVETRTLDPFDPNERRETATPLATGERVDGTAAAYDEDWFAVEADAGQRLTVETSIESPLTLEVVGPDGETLATTGYSGTGNPAGVQKTLNVTADRNGTYYLRVGQTDVNPDLLAVGSYEVTVRSDGTGTDAGDPDGDDGADGSAGDGGETDEAPDDGDADGGTGDGDGTDDDSDADGDGDTDGAGGDGEDSDDADDGDGDDGESGDADDGDESDSGNGDGKGSDDGDDGEDGEGGDGDEEPTDTDGDGLTDAEEESLGTDPTSVDTDGDGLTDCEEVREYGTDPTCHDTDGDGWSDAEEVDAGCDPTDPDSHP